jgi:hypothetical protein
VNPVSGPPLLAWGLIALGALLILVGTARTAAQQRRFRSWTRTTGQVVDEPLGVGAAPGRGRRMVVEFDSERGPVRGSPRWSTWNGVSRIGRRVDVWYDPQQPDRFDALTGLSDRAGYLWYLVGAPVLLVGVLGSL